MRSRVATSLIASTRAGAWILVAVAGLVIPGCTTDTRNTDGSTDPFATLRALAGRASDSGRDLPPPADSLVGLKAGDSGFADAVRSLDSLRPEDLAPPLAGDTDPSEIEQPDRAADRLDALRLYAESRQRLADGDPNRAIGLLDRASKLDPMSPEIWRSLGDARRAARYENSAGSAYLRAAELGIAEPQSLTLAGLHAAGQGETGLAASILLRAVRAQPAHADPLVAYVANASLGESLIALGFTSAGAEALEAGIGIPRIARVPTELPREAADVQRRRAALSLLLGDAQVRLGRFADAAETYDAVRLLPGASGVRERLIYALRQSGNDAAAALILLEELGEGGRVSTETTGLLAELSGVIRPRSAIGDAIGAIDDRGSATRRGRLIVAQSACLPRTPALRLLENSLLDRADLSAPTRRQLFIAALDRHDTEPGKNSFNQAVQWAARVVGKDPRLAGDAAFAITRSRAVPGGRSGDLLDGVRSGVARSALFAELAILREDRPAIGVALEASAEEPQNESATIVARRARLAAALGRWEVVDAAIGELRGAESPAQRAAALRSAQRFGEALASLRLDPSLLGSPNPPVDKLLELASLEATAGEPENARVSLESARDSDPRDERTYAALLSFHAPDGPDPDAQAVTAVGRQLREVLPESTLLQTMLAGEMLRRNLIPDAKAIIVPLFEAETTDPARLDAVLNLWRRRAAAGLADENELGLVSAAAAARPNDPGLARLVAGGFVLAGTADLAAESIDRFESSTGDQTLATLREQIVRDGLGDADGATALAIARLAGPTRSIDDSVALAGVYAASLGGATEPNGAIADILGVLSEVPGSAELTTAQRSSAANSVVRAAVVIDAARRAGDNSEDGRDAMLGLLDWATGRELDLAPGIHELRLALLGDAEAPVLSIIAAAEQAIAGTADAAAPNIARAFLRRAADTMTAAGNTQGAFLWLADRSVGTAELDEEAFQEWFRLVIVTSSNEPEPGVDRARELIDRLGEADLLEEAWTLVRPDAAAWTDRGQGDSAEMAYLLALYAPDPDGSGGVRRRFLRLSLAYDPLHPWANNDLGYTMLEAGGDLAEAERLIEVAYNAKPDQANIADSLGWVRYHRGILEDSRDAATGEDRPGAISLLQQAVELSDPDDDGVVHDHLGDALFAAGRTDEAIEAWRAAARLANQALSRVRASGQIGGVRSEELSDLAVRAIMKPNAIQIGQAPRIEPQRGLMAENGEKE